MAVGLIIQFSGVGVERYDQVMQHLELPLHDDSGTNWPDGIVSHVAGAGADGSLTVVDVWDSQAAFDRFFENRLRRAFEAVGGLPQPTITSFEVHNTYRHGSPA